MGAAISKSNAGVPRRARLSFSWEPLETVLAEPNLREVLVAYWQELSPVKHLPLDVDWPTIFAWERQFIFRVWVARVDGTMAGFITWLIQPHFLHRNTMFAIDHGHYLAPAFRNEGMVGMRMWRSTKVALKESGCEFAFVHDNALRPLSPFFLALGARPFSAMWVMDLRDDNHD